LIDRREILDFSREFGLAPHIIEKDYVIGWILAGISNHKDLAPHWVFKGGTCLKKCFFETYRFSEDLDFTIKNPDHLKQEILTNAFKEISNWVYENAGIEIPPNLIQFEFYTNPRAKIFVQGKISYRAPLQRGGDLPRIKLDLTSDELLALDPVSREVHHPYSDEPEESISAQCYSFEELFAEKIRALGERLRPRDLYDVIHLHRHAGRDANRALIKDTLEKKCQFKGISIPTMESLGSKAERAELEGEWENMLAHQLPVLPPFEQFWSEISAVFAWLYQAVEKIIPPSMPLMGMPVDDTWQPPAMAHAWHTTTPFEVIRFAAANHLCVGLTYNGTHRLIEPYSLRRTRDGNLLLYAVKHDTGEDRSYRVDRIQGAEPTKISFNPRYVVELTPSGPFAAQPISRKSTGAWKTRAIGMDYSKGASPHGPKYIFRCMTCGKQFTRKSYDASLNQHKNKQGYPCFGRIGTYIRTEY
jgi:predicted nucleotidyltransferase component of viral defense system